MRLKAVSSKTSIKSKRNKVVKNESVSIEGFQGILSTLPEDYIPQLDILVVKGKEWLLSHENKVVHTSLEKIRIFRKSDALIEYVYRNLTKVLSRSIEIRLLVNKDTFDSGQ